MSGNDDPQYQQQQLEQLKYETSQISAETVNEHAWTTQGIPPNIVQKLRLCIDNGKLASSDIDNRVCEQLRSFPDDLTSVNSLFDEFDHSDLTGVVNKGAFLCNLIKQWKIRNPQPLRTTTNGGQDFGDASTSNKPGPNETKMKEILDRTGYKSEVTAGQRKYGGPPPDGPDRPAANSEVFIGKLPREIFEDELIPLCEDAGKIWDLRLMIDPASGWNKGYCFVTYCSQPDAVKACAHLNGYALRPGKLIQANISVANLRLFIGNIPKTKSKEEIQEELSKVVDGVANVIIYAPADEADKKKNRGFCFVDFDTHKNASSAKRKLTGGRVRVFSRDIAVDWADPTDEPDEDVMAQVKVLYVRNITSDVTETDVKDLFLPYGNIERVRKVRDYAFVHFDKRDDALNAMRALNGKTLGRNAMEISLAKPLNDKRKNAQVKREQRQQFDPPSHPRGRVNDNPRGGHRGGPPTRSFGSSFQRGNGRAMNRADGPPTPQQFGAFTRDGPVNNGPMRGGFSNRGTRGGYASHRGGGMNPSNRGRGGHSNQNNPGGFNHNSGGSGYGGPPPPQNYNTGNFNHNPSHSASVDFGAFNNSSHNNNSDQYGQMDMNNAGFGANSMPPYSGMKRASNPMNDGNMPKRPRPNHAESWGSTGGDNSYYAPQHQQPNPGGPWYQDQGYNNGQQSSSYSWN